MPIKHSALKAIRQDRARTARNHAMRSELKTLTKRLAGLLRENKRDEAATVLRLVAKKYDVAASKGIVHKNAAARVKSRYTRQLNTARA